MNRAIFFAGALASVACRDAIKGEAEPAGAASDAPVEDVVIDVPVDAPSSYCDIVNPKPIFCDDFEGVFKERWDNSNRTPDQGELNGGTLTLDDTLSKSPPFSALIQTPALVDPTQSAGAIFVRTIHDPGPDYMFEGEFRVVTEYWPDAGTTTVLPIFFLSFEGIGTLFVYRSSSGVPGINTVLTGGTPNVVFLTRPFPVGEWKTLSIVIRNYPVDETGPHGEIKVRIDDLDAGVDQLPPEFQAVTELKLIYGRVATGPIGKFAMNLDNVRVYDRSDL